MNAEGPVAGAARAGFASGMMGLGLLSILYGGFSLPWEPVPAFVPNQLAYISGAVLVLASAALAIRGAMAWGALGVMAFIGFWALVLKFPEDLAATSRATRPADVLGIWLGAAQNIQMICGAWTLYMLSVRGGARPAVAILNGDKARRVIRILFGIGCIECGLCHFAFADITAALVPPWLPDRLFFAWLTGAGHVCAGVALITGVLPRLAATLEAAMMSSFVLLVQIPMVLWHKAGEGHYDWTVLFIAAGLASSAWAIAGSLKDRSWGLKALGLPLIHWPKAAA